MYEQVLERTGLTFDRLIEQGEKELRLRARNAYYCTRKSLQTPVSVPQVLHELGVPPFDPKSVKSYKRKWFLHYFYKSAPYWIDRTLMYLCFSAIIGIVVSLISTAILVLLRSNGWPEATAAVSATCGVVALGCGLVGKVFGWVSPQILYETHWQKSLYWMDDDMPQYALATAVEVLERCPQAVVLVESLYVRQRQADPFLVVKDGDKEYYVEVWNEPNFKAKRIA